MSEETQDLNIPELVAVIDGTVNDLKKYVSENSLTDRQLQQILETEKASKKRKTVIEFLERRIEEREVSSTLNLAKEEIDHIESIISELEDYELFQEAAETEEIDTETLLQLVGGTVDQLKGYVRQHNLGNDELQELLDAEKTVKDRKTAKGFLQKQIDKLNIDEDIEEAEKDIEKLKQDIETIESKTEAEPLEEGSEEYDEIADALDEVSKEIEGEDTESEEEQETEPEDERNSDQKKTEESDELDEKREILEHLDIELTEEELEDISLEHLKELKDEKEEREQLIEELTDHGFDEEDLKSATTEDLKKISESLPEEESKSEKEGEEKDEEEIREEAEEDLEMLMGAVKSKDETKDEKDRLKDLKQFKSKISGIFDRGSEEEEQEKQGMNAENVLEILQKYEQLNDKEAAIKTAHIMKGYLEYTENIDREMTYKELSDTLEGADNESLQRVLNFFEKMHIDQYTGDMENIDIQEAINASKQTVEELG